MSITNYSQADIQAMLAAAAQQYGVPIDFVMAVAKTESSFDPNALSSAGAIGVMQLMPGTAAQLGVDPYNVQQNIDGGVQLLSNYLNQYDGNLNTVLWAYNAGPGNVSKGILPAETANYIPTVLANMADFSNTYYQDTTGTTPTDTSGDTVNLFGYDVPLNVALAGGAAALAALWLSFR